VALWLSKAIHDEMQQITSSQALNCYVFSRRAFFSLVHAPVFIRIEIA
jgi:hypothetical protein